MNECHFRFKYISVGFSNSNIFLLVKETESVGKDSSTSSMDWAGFCSIDKPSCFCKQIPKKKKKIGEGDN